ncbi:hypothetical protein CBR_g42062 [Chara braunii]|uniref:Solute carrier family 40 member n=1 Tax=Chara braunii TaxID=69332 RepID=A0A388LWT0_CHABU|nr:hypothetical protein CBR_g42062 [Chara braunii]|eukprot:GBG86778.1 hypothetical protein CBR_g42062 [Chara braunii]
MWHKGEEEVGRGGGEGGGEGRTRRTRGCNGGRKGGWRRSREWFEDAGRGHMSGRRRRCKEEEELDAVGREAIAAAMRVTFPFLARLHLDPAEELLTAQALQVVWTFFKLLDVHECNIMEDVVFEAFMRLSTDLDLRQIRLVFTMFDVDNNGFIDFDEFYLLCCMLIAMKDCRERNFMSSHALTCFKLLDNDGSESLTIEEFERFGFVFNMDKSITRHFLSVRTRIQTSLVIQNASIIAASFAVGALLLDQHITGKSFLYVIATINLFGGIAALAGLGLNVAKEKDWVVVISSVQGEGMLARMNATMRRIDLSCLLLAPVAVGFLMSFLSMLSAAIAIATWNLVSFFLESYLLYRVYIAEPALALPRAVDSSIILKGDAAQIPSIDAGDDGLKRRNSRCGGCGITADVEHAAVDSGIGSCVQGHSTDNASAELNEPLLQGTRVSAAATGIRSPKPTLKADTNDSLKKLREGLRIYFRQPSLLPSLALACLYCTVLSFHSAMVAFLKLKNISPFTLSIVRGLAAVTGIMATVTFPCTSMQLHPSTTKCQGV